MTQFVIDRRRLFEGAGALVVSIGIPGGFTAAEPGAAVKPPGSTVPPTFTPFSCQSTLRRLEA
jgi:hypothetical protein